MRLDVPSDETLRGPVWLGMAGRRWPLAAGKAPSGLPPRPREPVGNTPPGGGCRATAGDTDERPSRDRGSGAARRHSRRRRRLGAHLPDAHLLRPDGDPVRRLQPRAYGGFGCSGQAVLTHEVTGREDGRVAGMVRAAVTAVCQLGGS